MIEIELPDGSIAEFPEGTTDDVIVASIKEFFASPQPKDDSDRSFGRGIWENLTGEDPTMGENIRGAGAAVARGMADVPALPANLAQLGAMGVEKALGMEEPSMVSRALNKLPDTRDMLAAVPIIGPESQYVAPGKQGEYIKTIGEMAGAAGAMASLTGQGTKAVLDTSVRYGALPGLASEAAGQAVKGTSLEEYEPYARTAAALATPLAIAGASKLASPMVGKISKNRQAAVDLLKREGITPTAGQVVGGKVAESQLYREASTKAGREIADKALEDFTGAALKRIGSTGKGATPEVLVEANSRIGTVFNDVVDGVNVMPTGKDLASMSKGLETYRQLSAGGQVKPIFLNINKELVKSFRTERPIPAEIVKNWRSMLSKLTRDADAATREAAISTMNAVDDTINAALVAAGKTESIKKLATARDQYRNLLAIEKAAERANIEGIISPKALRTALLGQSRRGYAQGKRDLDKLTKAAAEVLSDLPNSGTSQRLTAQQLLPSAGTGTAAGLGAAAFGVAPVTAGVIGLGAALAPPARNALLSSKAGQAYMQNQLIKGGAASAGQGAAAMAPGLLSQR